MPPTEASALAQLRSADITLIRPHRGWVPVDLAELWRYRELLFFLVWRDVKVRYKQTVLGIAWAVIQPVLSMLIFTVVFGHLVKVDSEGFPYPVFVYAGLLPWTFFSASVSIVGLSLVNNQAMLTKIYFPRIFVPTSGVGAGLLDLALGFAVYAPILWWYGVGLRAEALLVLPFVVLTVLATLGSGYLLAALTVAYRDFRYVISFMLQTMMYVSPVVYPVGIVPERFHWLLALNPMTGIIDGYRSAILGKPWKLDLLATSAVATLALFVFAVYYFRRVERRFADIA
jgi:lipopolysaccharide transport system permease protein